MFSCLCLELFIQLFLIGFENHLCQLHGTGAVCRNLSLLSDMGLITTLETLDKSIHYDGNTDSHSHFICERCSKIIDLGVERGLPEDISELGLLMRHKKIIYYGLCPDCQQNTAEDNDAGVLQ